LKKKIAIWRNFSEIRNAASSLQQPMIMMDGWVDGGMGESLLRRPASSSLFLFFVFEPLLALVFFKLVRAFFVSRLSSNGSNSLFLKFEEQLLWIFFFLFVLFWRKNHLKLFFFFLLFLSFAVWIF
jgi:hypothetical protein